MTSFHAFSKALLLAFGMLAFGCFSVYEAPPVSAPLLGKRNDLAVSAGVRANAAYESRGMHPGGYGEVAWAPSDHSRVVASAAHIKGGASEGSYGNHTQGLLAAGWGTAIVPAFRIEALGGAGFDRFDVSECDFSIDGRNETCLDWMDGKGRSGRAFGQIHAGVATAPVEVLGGLRTTVMFVAFSQLRLRRDNPEGQEVPFSTRTLTVPIVEPFLAVRGGYKWIKAELQLSIPFAVQSPEQNSVPLVQNSGPRISLGLRASFQELWKKRSFMDGFRREGAAP